MSLKETNKKLSKIKLEEETKEAFLDLIDTKIDTDMEKAINRFETSIDKLETSIESLKEGNKIIFWVIGSAMAVITILLAVIALKK